MRKGDPAQILDLIHQLDLLRAEMLNLEAESLADCSDLHPDHRASARNLLHYLALRRHDIRALQEQLAAMGLSSLGRTESHVIGAVHSVIDVLAKLAGADVPAPGPNESTVAQGDGQKLLEKNTDTLLGRAPDGRRVRIMVTMPSEAGVNYALVRDLVQNGMDCMRINCAHDGPDTWSGMISNLRRAEKETGKTCKVAMDLAGPKLRTGPIESGPAVLKYRPKRDSYGRVESPARVWFTPEPNSTELAPPKSNAPEFTRSGTDRPGSHPPEPDPYIDVSPISPEAAVIPVPGEWLANLAPGARIRFTDTRGARRFMTVTTKSSPDGCWAEASRTAYLAPGIVLEAVVAPGKMSGTTFGTKSGTAASAQSDSALHSNELGDFRFARVGPIPPEAQTIRLKKGDILLLTRSLAPGQPAQFDENKELFRPASIGVSLGEFFDCVRAGEPIWFDDGKIGGVIVETAHDHAYVEITHAPPSGAKLGAEKGVNVPETDLRLSSLTPEDLQTLDFIVANADIVGYSFVRSPEDVRDLQSHLAQLGATGIGIILKIETRQGFANLPHILLAAMKSRPVGVMIARGDLAVECGYQRLAEVQEEILWICEAAHLPVIWATQVLESLAKAGVPSRSEITDAAMGERAECVMLNKGPYIVDAVRILDDILSRMESHQEKKRSMLRKLRVASAFSASHSA